MKKKTRAATILFVIGLLMAGAANALAKYVIQIYMNDASTPLKLPFLSTALFCLNLAIYFCLLLFWVQSAKHRLLPSRERSYLIAAACCAITMLVLRSVKYRVIEETDLTALRYTWYAYYIPMITLATLFLMTCIRIENKNRPKRFDERLLLIPSCIFILLFLTNDLHYLAFKQIVDYVEITGATNTYRNNILFYLYYAYYAVAIGLGLFFLTKANRRLHNMKKAALPFIFLLVMLVLCLVDKGLGLASMPSMFMIPEIVAFGMVGVFESCIRNRLIPYNENYTGFFERMRFPVVITDRDLTVEYHTAEPVIAEPEQMKASLSQPVYLTGDNKLSGNKLKAGYAFYMEDVGELNRLNMRLTEANELIASENDLISAENELKKRRAEVDSRNMIYARISEKMYPWHRRAQALLDDAKPNTPGFHDTIARLNILNAYIKRAANLMLTDEGSSDIECRELYMALEESARYLKYCGVEATVNFSGDGRIDREKALSLYTAFEEIVDSLLGSITMLNIASNGKELRLTADCSAAPDLSPGELPVTVRESDGLYFFIVSSENGGAL